MELLTFLVIGLVAGMVSTRLLKSPGYGPVIDTIIGAFGATIAAPLYALAGLTASGHISMLAAFVVALALHTVVGTLPTK
jgi:uncharacterized membrane protein YeaQ/YmgE (transglycosylase-associated protein family)